MDGVSGAFLASGDVVSFLFLLICPVFFNFQAVICCYFIYCFSNRCVLFCSALDILIDLFVDCLPLVNEKW